MTNTQVVLLMLADVKWGGFVTFNIHMSWALERLGFRTVVAKLSPKVSTVQFPLGQGVFFRRIDLHSAIKLSRAGRLLITCLYWKQHGEDALHLLEAGAGVVLHDPTEYEPGLIAAIKKHGTKVVSIRTKNVANLAALGVRSLFIKHPYVRWPHSPRARLHHAIGLSRIDWDKHTDEIAQANAMLAPELRVHLFGAINRMYEYHKLTSACPGWKDEYRGTFPTTPGAAVELAAASNWVVDLSAIKGDGGGTQSTFMEAWDGGAGVVISKKWCTGTDDEMQPGVNCEAVEGPAELARLLAAGPPSQRVLDGGKAALDHHRPGDVAYAYARFLGWA